MVPAYADDGPGVLPAAANGLQTFTSSRTIAALSFKHRSCTWRTLGGAQFYIARERCAYLVFGCLVLGVSPVAGWPCAIREQSSAAGVHPLAGCFLRFFARNLRVVNGLKTALGAASRPSGWRPSLWRPSASQRRARFLVDIS